MGKVTAKHDMARACKPEYQRQNFWASGQCKIKVEAASLGVLYWEEVSKFRSSPPEGTDRDGPQDIDHSLEMFVITSEKLWSVLEPDLQFRQPIWRRQTRPSQ